MKKRSLLLILVLTISLAIPIFLTQTQPVYTQLYYINSHTYIIPPQNLTKDSSIQINSNVTTNLGVLIEGNVGVWILSINALCYDPNENITNITINGQPSSRINRGLMIPITNAFASNQVMNINLSKPPFYTAIAFLINTETVLIPSGTAGFPSITSFNLSATVELKNGENEIIYLASDLPVISLVLPNPSNTPQIVNYYLGFSVLLAILLPATFVLSDRWLKRRRIKKESVEGV